MTKLLHKTARVNSSLVSYIETSHSQNTKHSLVMLAGWPVSAISLEPLARTLTTNVKSFCVNLPGYGGSTTKKNISHTFTHYAQFLCSFQENIIKQQKVNIFGYSTGGILALHYASMYPTHVEKIILFSPPYNGREHFNNDKKQKTSRYALYKLLDKYAGSLLLLNIPFIKSLLLKHLFYTYYKNKYPKLFDMEKIFIRRMLDDTCKLHAKAAWDLAKEIATKDFSKYAKMTKAQTLVFAPENDQAVHPAVSKILATRLLQKGTYCQIPQADHAVGIYEPYRLTKEILRFLNNNK